MLLIACLALAAVQWPTFPLLDRREYVSESGACRLEVLPDDRLGEGGAEYTLWRGERRVWQVQHDFALREAAVSDAGLVVGWARGWELDPKGAEDTALLVVAALTPSGALLRQEVTRRHTSFAMHAPAWPEPRGLVADFAHDRFFVRVGMEAEFDEVWWPYRASTGERLPDADEATLAEAESETAQSNAGLADDERERALDAARLARGLWPQQGLTRLIERDADAQLALQEATRVEGVELYLLRWIVSRGDARDAAYTLMNAHGATVWALVQPNGYPARPNVRSEQPDPARETLMMASLGDGRFSIDMLSSGERVLFQAQRDADETWTVDELARATTEFAAVKRAVPGWRTETLRLDKLRSLPLKAKRADYDPPFHGVAAWDVFEQAELHTIRLSDKGSVVRIRQDLEFRHLGEQELHPMPPINASAIDPETGTTYVCRWFALGDDRWMVSGQVFGSPGPWLPYVAIADGRTGAVEPLRFLPAELPGQKLYGVQRAIGLADGGAAMVLGMLQPPGSALIVLDPSGAVRWQVRQMGSARDGSFAFTDLAETDSGALVVLKGLARELCVWASDGTPLDVYPLATVLPEPTRTLQRLVRGYNERVFVIDRDTGKPCWSVDLSTGDAEPIMDDFDGLDPRRKLRLDMARSHDRALWAHDELRLWGLDDLGGLSEIFVPAVDTAKLNWIGAHGILRDGRIVIQDRATGVVHLWSDTGSAVGSYSAQANQVFDWSRSARVVSDGEGGLWIGGATTEWASAWQDWSVDGEGRGVSELMPRLAFERDGFGVWTWGRFDRIEHDPRNGDLVQVFEQHVDGRWYRGVNAVTTGADGSVFVWEDELGDDPAHVAHLVRYSPSGEELDAVLIGDVTPVDSDAAQAGHLVLVDCANELALLDLSQPDDLLLYTLEGPDDLGRGQWALSPDGTELRRLDVDEMLVRRWQIELPKR